jgi:DNA-binding LacI/PurR family transcriptional regulator
LKKIIEGWQTHKIGVFAFSDYLAMDLMRILCQLNRGGNIGNNIKIVGYDNIAASSHTYPPLTTISQPFRELGNCGMQKLLNIISGSDNNLFKMPYPKLVVRESA